MTRTHSLTVLVFFVSAGIVAYQVFLARLLALVQWHHLAFMVISIAMLGFGAAGALLALRQLRRPRVAPPDDPYHTETPPAYFPPQELPPATRPRRVDAFPEICTVLFGLSLAPAFALGQFIPFDIYEAAWKPQQYAYLLLYYAVFSIPFTCGAAAIGYAYIAARARPAPTYLANMVGSGVGALAATLALSYFSPLKGLEAVAASITVLALALMSQHNSRLAIRLAMAALVVLASLKLWPVELAISGRKGLPAVLRLPQARHLAAVYSARGRLDVVSSPALHLAPGLSLTFKGGIPAQLALTRDAGPPEAVTHSTGTKGELAYLGHFVAFAPVEDIDNL